MRSHVYLLGLAGFLLSSCGDDDGGGGSASEQVASRLKECQLVTEGKVTVNVPNLAISECQAACQSEATCEELQALQCGRVMSDRLNSCYADCATQDCADGQGSYLFVQACDGIEQCDDASDETGCPAPSNDPEFCRVNGNRITRLTRCNGVDDCGDGTDEANCPAPAASFTCVGTVPGISIQIPASWVCDLKPDCPDGSDESEEQGCARLTCNN